MRLRQFAYVAAAMAIASAVPSVFWTLGGTLLLDTVGGSIERLARARSVSALVLGATTSLAKLGAALLALSLVRPWGRRVPWRLAANALTSALLVTWGGANVIVGALALTRVVSPADGLDEYALRWHVYVWDPWFLIWGAALALALVSFRREHSDDRQPGMSGVRAQVPGSGSAQDERRHPFPSPARQGKLEVDSTKEAQ
ncbi:MAG TPA: DUF3995 domain-containing protein [Solirubrobacteraceae bacterium]|nr:DUF3995 domain-containing protein [Solirubrobacteraceae bacterium]